MLNHCRPIGLALLAVLAGAFLVLGVGTDARADEPRKTEATPDKPDLSARIDAEIDKVLKRDEITPAPPSSDAEFLRRVYLDVIGLPPSADEARAFLDDESGDKRARLIDRLLDDPRFGEHIADQWLTILVGRGKSKKNTDLVLGKWIADAVNAGRPFNELIYEMLAAEGTMAENPAVAYYTSKNNLMTPDIAGEATRHFLGVQIQCAQCHDHPYEDDWKVADFNGMAAFFWPMRIKRNGKAQPRLGVVSDRNGKRIAFDSLEKKIAQTPLTELDTILKAGRWQSPKFLGAEEFKVNDARKWRQGFAKWVAKDNPQTQRYLANRFWSFLFGMGILNPVDDFNSFNVPSHPELLELLADDFAQHGYDAKRFYRAVLKTKTYQRSSSKPDAAEAWHFAGYPVRQLTPEQFFAALINVQNAAEGRRRISGQNPWTPMRRRAEGKDTRKRAKKVEYDLENIIKLEEQLMGASDEWFARRSASRGYARYVEDDEMIELDGFTLTIDQALLVMNGKETAVLSDGGRGSVIDTVIRSGDNDAARLEQLFLIVLSRRPNFAESKLMLGHLKQTKNQREAWEDILFALLQTTEFATNH